MAIAAVGGLLGWAGYYAQQPQWILGNCTGTISTVPGVPAPPCVPPPNVQIPLDPINAFSWAVGGALLALALCGLAVWLASELRERRGVS